MSNGVPVESDDKNRIAELEKALASVSKDVDTLYDVMYQAWNDDKLPNSWWDGNPKELGDLVDEGTNRVWGRVTRALKDKIQNEISVVANQS